MKRLIYVSSVLQLNRLLTDPQNICKNCNEFGSDCLGVSRCYENDSYLVIEYELRKPEPGEIEEMIKA